MKNKYFIPAIFLLITGSVFTGCNNRDDTKEKVEEAKKAMIEAQTQFE